MVIKKIKKKRKSENFFIRERRWDMQYEHNTAGTRMGVTRWEKGDKRQELGDRI